MSVSHPTTVWHAIFDGLRALYRNVKRAVATASEHDGRALVVDADVETVEAALGRRYFAPNWQLSYYERGEVLNLARVEYGTETAQNHEFEWWQTHVRGWHHDDDSVRLRCHYELEPSMNDQDHLDGVGIDIERGTAVVAGVLDDAELDYAEREDLPAGH